jgi:hypothetical protein
VPVPQQHQHHHHQMEVGARPTTLEQDHQQATTNQLLHRLYLKKLLLAVSRHAVFWMNKHPEGLRRKKLDERNESIASAIVHVSFIHE